MREGWEYKKLGEVCEIVGGSTPLTSVPENWIGDNFWVTPAELDGTKYVSSTERTISNDAASRLQLMPPGTVLLSSRAPIGKVAITTVPMYCNQGFKNAICGELLNNEFVYWYFVYSKETLQALGKGATFKEISKRDVEAFTIPVPPLSEQQRIVSELDLLTSIIDKQKAQLKELDTLAQSIFYDMFGDPVENEKGWEVKKLEEVCDAIGDGLHGTPEYDVNGRIAFINGNNLVNGRIVINEKTQYVSEEEAKKIYIPLSLNTVLVSINGSLGKVALYNGEDVVLGKSACYCSLGNLLHPLFVLNLMKTSTFQDFLESNSSKSTIKNVGLKAMRSYKIILPPLPLQQLFAAKIEAIEKQKASISSSLAETQKLFDYTMDKYFG